MKYSKHLILGVFFGFLLSKAEVVSWFQIYEMFHFRSFHMYGIIGSAILTGMVAIQVIKYFKIKDIDGNIIDIPAKNFSIPRYLYGGIIFGFGWAMTGACPGPLFILLGHKISVIMVTILATLFGTYGYGLLRKFLPH